jgi:MFS family permease
MFITSNTTDKPLYPAGVAWSGLGVLYLGFMSMGAMFHLIPPILSHVIADQGLSHTQGGMLMSLFALPGVFLSLWSGWLVDRFGARLVGSLGILVMGASTVALAYGGNFLLILLARLITGVGAVFGVVAMQRMVTRLFQGRPLGLPTGISGSAVPVGIVWIYNVAGPMADQWGWRTVPIRAGLVCMAVAVVFFLAGRTLFNRPNEDRVPSGVLAKDHRPGGLRLIWIAGLIWFSINGAMTAFLTFAPDHFLDLGFASRERGLFTSIPMWSSAMLGPMIGMLADRLGAKPLFIALGMGLLTLCLALVAGEGAAPMLLGFGFGGAMALVVTPLLSLPGEILPPSHHGRGFGILSTWANAGIFVVPPVAGMVRDGSGGYFWPFIMMAGLALGGVLVAGILHRQTRVQGFE